MSDWKDQLSQLVYSTDQGKIAPEAEPEKIAESDGFVRLRRETKGRKGKGVTIVSGIPVSETDLKAIAKKLKQLCSVGGSVKFPNIELQGDQRDTIEPWLIQHGYRVKRSGG
ncbi:stress response translation initiation inhibitor YciH [Idiomarina tyrosinivorans]|uniref:Stress response translation initiation inhibitor YciH n=1 Tax=Idiomarina tyrosinivorans TaxID=1445662 RepID=A0A432ZLV1_9GAMM|nr:stress response translation initiation inhibitor YciH [Idiomarina tyrosinivorans]RUO78880.1 stress response translation initiation inhibitor YciH [Idiomarina tyrosinivorans]